MQEPFEPPPADQNGSTKSAADEIVASPENPDELDPALTRSGNSEAPLREIAHAFRMNAEALHTLKQMQDDLARSVKKGDRSELVLQSTRSLNETFRNLTAVQRELLGRMQQGGSAQRSPLIPLMLLGLLVVLLGGVYVILDAVDQKSANTPGIDPAEIARRERDSWREGRREGAQQADREIKRLHEAAEEAKQRRQTIQNELDSKVEVLTQLERGKRVAEMERDEFAGQVRKAQNEIVAKNALEEEITSLRLQLDAANKAASKAEHEMGLQRSRNAYLRERLADYGLGIAADDPPWRPGLPAGATPEGVNPVVDLNEKKDGEKTNSELLNIYLAGREKTDAAPKAVADLESKGPPRNLLTGDSSVPPPAPAADDPRIPTSDFRVSPPTQPVVSPPRQPKTATPRTPPAPVQPRRGAAYGGDAPGARPPAAIRGGDPRLDREPKSVDRVRAHLNGLLQRRSGGGGAGWTITRIQGVSADRLGGVTMARYDASGKMVESIEAADVRIAVDREQRRVRFVFREGLRYDRGVRAPLPPTGMPLIMAQGANETNAWSGSPLRVIKKR